MPNLFSKPLDKVQRTIGIYTAETSQGVFSGWGLSSQQQHNPTVSLNKGKSIEELKTTKAVKKWYCPCCKKD